ncbi:MAG TPA: NAD(P)H-binding protein [Pedobacter sp.]|nr:NAD(P)H-binding protein [Pedobacter sp.]
MKIILTGSLGNISKPLAIELIKKGHDITIVSSNAAKQDEIEALGATAAIGSLEDADFLSRTFKGADAVYTMVPPGNYFDPNFDLIAYYIRLGENYARAIEASGIKRVVNLSTIGGNLKEGNGILAGAYNVEQILNQLPEAVSIAHMRPNSFYYNLLGYINGIKSEGVIAANYGGDHVIPWVSPSDIATAVAEELLSTVSGRKVRSVASEDLSGNETAKILGEAIGKPDLTWEIISDEETLNGLVSIGMNPNIAAGLVEMYSALHNGTLAADYYRNKPVVMGKVKMKDFAKDFAAAFNQ